MIERDNALKDARKELADESKKAPNIVDFIIEARENHALTRTELIDALSGLEAPAMPPQ